MLIVHPSWSASPPWTLAGAGLLALFLGHGCWAASRRPAPEHHRRGLAAVTATGFTAAFSTAAFLVFHVPDFGCV